MKTRSSDAQPTLLRTSELLARTGITHQVLYRYVTLGLLEPAQSTDGGQRLFQPTAVTLVRLVRSLNESGYSLRDIKEIFFKDERVRRAAEHGGPIVKL